MLVRNIYSLIFLLFRPGKFIEIAVRDAWRQFFEVSRKLPDSKITEVIPPDKQAEWTAEHARRTASLRGSIFGSLMLLVFAVVASFLTTRIAKALGWDFSDSTRSLQLVSLALFVWATLGELGWDIQTLKGRSLAEVVNRFWFRTLYTIGAYLGSFTFWW